MNLATAAAPIPENPPAWSLLDEPQEWDSFGREQAAQAGVWESHIMLQGMHCAACSLTIEEAVARVPGVQSVQVSAATHRAKVVWSAQATKPSQWFAAIVQAGYSAIPAGDAWDAEQRKQQARTTLWRLGVAGLCMMQVMMYAWPAYTARPGDLSLEMEQLLRWASWVLSLPVMLFSCVPFLRSAWRDLWRRQISMDLPVAIGMLVTFVVSTMGTFNPSGLWGREVYFDSLTMFVFFLLAGRWLEQRIQNRTAGILNALFNRLPQGVVRQKADGTTETVAVRRLHVGDCFQVLPGEAFAADGVISQGQTQVDEALLTGESTPLQRQVGDAVVAGSYNLQGRVWVRATGVGQHTRFGQIVGLMEQAASTKPRSVQVVDKLAKPFLLAVLLAAVVVCAWWWPSNPEHAIMVAVSVLVVTCPCALSLATPAALVAAAGSLAKHDVLVRDLQALDSMNRVDTVVFDKTGTLTQAGQRVASMQQRSDWTQGQALQLAAALAQHSLHPYSKAMVVAAAAMAGANPDRLAHVVLPSAGALREVPGQGVVWEGEAHVQEHLQVDAHVLHAPVRLGSAAFCGLHDPVPAGQVHVADARGWIASIALDEQLHPQAAAVVQALQQAGMAVHLLSGDQVTAVRSVAERLGINDWHAGMAPQDKLAYLQALQQQRRTVAMVGDGLNDGPVLAGAHVAFAIGRAVPLAQARSDFIVLSGHLQAVQQVYLLARKTQRVVRQNLYWALAYNASCIPLAALGYLPAWLAGLGMALSSIVVVANAARLGRGLGALPA
ncbi:cation-translocating P-type ATPase [Curvibacter sp. CHRR-16]|uniref:heavy metal translocating P-type ATPase n=1 Tax=Curvibacter sp. CHRR-16 TaxID=2835872 RepID=UPI001BDA1ADF|nr:cation-translocating P-type ATPase [Curvibacter sp. CHRR-16]MBT0570671.1 cation-translocating P-type ATPase [Curvibacter sp. CHRR-16]